MDMTDTIKNGFRKCGLYPFNVDEVDFTKCVRDAQMRTTTQPPQPGRNFTDRHFEIAKDVFSLINDNLTKRGINTKIIECELEKARITYKGRSKSKTPRNSKSKTSRNSTSKTPCNSTSKTPRNSASKTPCNSSTKIASSTPAITFENINQPNVDKSVPKIGSLISLEDISIIPFDGTSPDVNLSIFSQDISLIENNFNTTVAVDVVREPLTKGVTSNISFNDTIQSELEENVTNALALSPMPKNRENIPLLDNSDNNNQSTNGASTIFYVDPPVSVICNSVTEKTIIAEPDVHPEPSTKAASSNVSSKQITLPGPEENLSHGLALSPAPVHLENIPLLDDIFIPNNAQSTKGVSTTFSVDPPASDICISANEETVIKSKEINAQPISLTSVDKENVQTDTDPFKRHLKYPLLVKETKRKPNIGYIPSAISCKIWRDYHEKKDQEKQEKEDNIRKRKMEKETKKVEQLMKKRKVERKKKKTQTEVRKKIKCDTCQEELISDAEDDAEKNIGCDHCIRWYHLKCTKLNKATYSSAAQSDFRCDFCETSDDIRKDILKEFNK